MDCEEFFAKIGELNEYFSDFLFFVNSEYSEIFGHCER